ncbi:hypothetical protein FDECE_888 [Fusarium decemcellulare]|nr:hypothetical protein FDECE_888 [Fusarium decemcellulare]
MGCCGSKIPANKPIENGSVNPQPLAPRPRTLQDYPPAPNTHQARSSRGVPGIQHTRLEITNLEIINLNITNTDLNITGLEITSTNLNITNLELTPIKLPPAPSLRRRLGSNANGD